MFAASGDRASLEVHLEPNKELGPDVATLSSPSLSRLQAVSAHSEEFPIKGVLAALIIVFLSAYCFVSFTFKRGLHLYTV